MSAETIPSEVRAIIADALRRVAYTDRFNYRAQADAVIAALASRSTRPAEPAASVAEAGDGEVSRYIAKCREMSKGENGHTYTWWSRLADLLSTLEAERARAAQAEADLHEVEEQFAKLQEAEAQAEEEACLRVAAEASLSRVLQDRDFWKERFQVESRSRIQAEQRAADAPCPRGEGRGAGADDRRRLDWIEANTSAVISHEGFEDDVWQIHTVSGNRSDLEWTKRAEADTVREAIDAAIRAIPPRASREAQPATDGGEA